MAINYLLKLKRIRRFSFDGLKLVPENYQVFRNGTEIVLTGKEFEILMLLVQNKGKRQIFLRIS